MSWRTTGGRTIEKQRIPQATATRNLPGFLHSLNQYGVQTRFQSDDLSLTATAMSTNGSFHEQQQQQRGMKLSSSDSKAISILRQPAIRTETRGLRRGHTMGGEIGLPERRLQLPPVKTKKQVSVDVLPPILPSSKKSDSGIDRVEDTLEGGMSSLVDDDDDGSSHGEESYSTEDEDLISDDDNSTNEEIPQSSLKFQDPSHSSFSSLAEVELPSLSNEHQPFVTTLIQEQLLANHECIMTGVTPSGMSSGVNNIVRAYEIKGPLDKQLLETALQNVVKAHPILSSTFHRHNDKLYAHIPKDSSVMHLETPLSYEKPPELITLARRKAFEISLINHKPSTTQTDQAVKHSTYVDFDDHLSVVSCGKDDSPKTEAKVANHPIEASALQQMSSNLPKLPSLDNSSFPPLIRAKLIPVNPPNEHVLILSFSRVVCDYWSSCLFIQQLSHSYGQLEKMPSYRPSLAVMRTINKRQEAVNHLESMRSKAGYKKTTRATQTRGRGGGGGGGGMARGGGLHGIGSMQNGFHLICPPKAQFQQMALRESMLLLIRPKERLWSFWESVVTVTLRRTRGPPRIKVIPPIRIPSGFGEITRTTGLARPTTARLRPLTARNRPQTARRGSGFGTDSMALESLSGPRKALQFIKIPEKVGFNFLQSLPIEYSAKIDRKELLSTMCLGVYVLMLGVCSKGWGLGDLTSRYSGHGGMEEDGTDTSQMVPAPDPLLKYNQGDIRLSQVLGGGGGGGGRSARRRSDSRKKMDAGSFLVGVNVSARQLAPELTQGLFGPLSNLVGMRVDLSSSPSFADLILSLWNSLQSARCHSHFPFTTVADELGLVQGLPVQFSYFYPHDVQQLSNPEGFHFMETSVGVTGKALARFGSSCYMNPLNTKMDDTAQLELLMWENVQGSGVDGIFLYQTQSLRSDVVEKFSTEMLKLLTQVSQRPTTPLKDLAAFINPPYLLTASRLRR